MSNGYHGKILHVHLDDLSLEVETPSEEFYRTYMGGSALGVYYLLKHTPKNTDPLNPQNTLALALSVLTGVPISGQSRLTAVAKSPLTGLVGDAQCGGFFPAEMKFAGFDAFIIHGKAEKPVYLWVRDGEAELRSAEHLWGKPTDEVEDLIMDELADSKIRVLQAGIAAEKKIPFAALIHMAGRAAGRTGMGAVMASKNLKAVAVRGKIRPPLADAEALNRLTRWGVDNFKDSDIYGLGLYGTAGGTRFQDASGGLPTRNWSSGTFEGVADIEGVKMNETIVKERDTCYACTVRCKRVVEVAEGDFCVDPRFGGPEYETVAAFGSYCGVDNLAAIAYANQLCNAYGVDTISCGATIAWAMDCFERDLLTTEDTGGIELRFGDEKAMIQMLEKLLKREGFGDILAEGSHKAAKKIGRGTEDLVVAVKGQELPAHMPQVKPTLGLIYAVNPFGADHQSHEHDGSYAGYPERMAQIGLSNPQPDLSLNEEMVHYALTTQHLCSALDSLNLCLFVYGPAWQLYGPSHIVELVNAVTGWDVDIDELLLLGERRLNLLRIFNAREEVGREGDRLPKKMFTALTGGKSDGLVLTHEEIEQAKDWYYQESGWDVQSGLPIRPKLEALELAWAADYLGK
ncbi:MAG: aldehyde ferredoxin oxidoreductase family protein [Anaerolineales bacterium]|jgi:aldehyde:ferredoxin oxidoreductase